MELFSSRLDLGHKSRNAACVRQVRLAAACGGGAIAAGVGSGRAGSHSDLASFYRFAGNDGADLEAMRAARREATLERAREDGGRVLLLHDPTLLDYSSHDSKTDRRPIGDGNGMGYEYMPLLAVSARTGAVLGVLHDAVLSKDGIDDADSPMRYDFDARLAGRGKLAENAPHGLAVRMRGLAEALAGIDAVYVADREFGDALVMEAGKTTAQDFVLRTREYRRVAVRPERWLGKAGKDARIAAPLRREGLRAVRIDEIAARIPAKPWQTIHVGADGRRCEPDAPGSRPALLGVAAVAARILPNATRCGEPVKLGIPLEVNLVVVREIKPPQNAKRLCWTLFTSLPADTVEKAGEAARIYSLRWGVESFFRLIKADCQIEKSRLTDAAKTARHLVILSVACVCILDLKRANGLGGSGKLDDEQFNRIKAAYKDPGACADNPPLATLALVLRLGGWLGRRRDPIGPTVLLRGVKALAAAECALRQHGELIMALRNKHPDGLLGFV
jgi:IS4 transposase